MPPRITVITVCLNELEAFKRTLKSIDDQECRDFEWIIIDGASTDGTREELSQQNAEWIRFISEEDDGIYDAMNKGLKRARGEWIWFMNAGDQFLDSSSIRRVVDASGSFDIVFGEVAVENSQREIIGTRSEVTPHNLPAELRKEQFQRGMVVSHQAFVVRRCIVPMFRNDKYALSADLDWMLTILETKRPSINVGKIARIARLGQTMQNWKRSQFERFLILSRHFGYIMTIVNHMHIAFRRLRHASNTRSWK